MTTNTTTTRAIPTQIRARIKVPNDPALILKLLPRVELPPAVVTETSLNPFTESFSILIFTRNWVGLRLVKLSTATPLPKLTEAALSKLLPLILTVRMAPWLPSLGLIEEIMGSACLTVKLLGKIQAPLAVMTEPSLAPPAGETSSLYTPGLRFLLFAVHSFFYVMGDIRPGVSAFFSPFATGSILPDVGINLHETSCYFLFHYWLNPTGPLFPDNPAQLSGPKCQFGDLVLLNCGHRHNLANRRKYQKADCP